MSMGNVIGDIRYGARVLRRNPVFTAVGILTLALGIGANTAVFNVMNAVLLRYLPVPDPERVVYLRVEGRPSGTWETGDDSLTFNEPAFEHMRGERRVLSDLVAFVPLGFCLLSKSDSFAKSALCRNPVMFKNPNQASIGGPERGFCLELGLAPWFVRQRTRRFSGQPAQGLADRTLLIGSN